MQRSWKGTKDGTVNPDCYHPESLVVWCCTGLCFALFVVTLYVLSLDLSNH